jgi:abortive infection bacteriophage resistance protein
MKYNKPPKTFNQQIDLLRTRGMIIDDRDAAGHYLAHLNYYRLAAYWLPFEADHSTHAFRKGTRFEDVLRLYVFDRELRLLVLDAIERVEVSLRTQWAYQLAHRHGPHAHLDPNLARSRDGWESATDILRDEIRRSDEVFIKHYKNKYGNPDLPPVWSVCEVMSLGLLSRWFTDLKPKATRSAITISYHLNEKILQGFVRHLSYIRNICAHHSRLWNRRFTITMRLPKSQPRQLVGSFNPGASRNIYNTLVMLAWMLDQISPGNRWKDRLLDLIRRHAIDPAPMGFPENYSHLYIWQDGGK